MSRPKYSYGRLEIGMQAAQPLPPARPNSSQRQHDAFVRGVYAGVAVSSVLFGGIALLVFLTLTNRIQ